MAKARLKTPISYYGGKQTMLKYILPLIPDHRSIRKPTAADAPCSSASNPYRARSSTT